MNALQVAAPPAPESPALRWYLTAVGGAGLALVAAAAVNGRGALENPPAELLLLSLFALLGELRPIRVSREGEEGEASSGTLFVFGILLTAGAAAAVLVQALSVLVADLAWRRAPWRVVAHAARYTIAIAAAGIELAFLRPDLSAASGFQTWDLLAVLAAAAVFFVTNYLLTSLQTAIQHRVPFLRQIVRHFIFHVSVTGALLALAPLVVAAARVQVALVPVVALPAIVIHQRAKAVLLNNHRAVHDSITELPNQLLLRDRIQHAITEAARTGGAVAVCVIDVETVREIEAAIGRSAAEDAARAVATALRAAGRRNATVASLAPDRFAYVRHVDRAEEAPSTARRLAETARISVSAEGTEVTIEPTVGVSLYPDHGDEADVLIRGAVAAARRARDRAAETLVYDPARDAPDRRHLAVTGQLRRAISEHSVALAYQPQVDGATGRIVGAEALSRWTVDGRRIDPETFVPVAERTGLIRPLTRLVLELAVRQAAEWTVTHRELRVAVNISAHSLYDDGFAREVSALLEQSGLLPGSLVIELTESAVVEDVETARSVLESLRDIGVGLALDDYGTGFSSLAHLKNLPVHELKIDRSFVTNIVRDRNDAGIVRSTIDMAHGLGLRVVAEGVESRDAAEALRSMGCDILQGFHIGRPMPPSDLSEALAVVRGA